MEGTEENLTINPWDTIIGNNEQGETTIAQGLSSPQLSTEGREAFAFDLDPFQGAYPEDPFQGAYPDTELQKLREDFDSFSLPEVVLDKFLEDPFLSSSDFTIPSTGFDTLEAIGMSLDLSIPVSEFPLVNVAESTDPPRTPTLDGSGGSTGTGGPNPDHLLSPRAIRLIKAQKATSPSKNTYITNYLTNRLDVAKFLHQNTTLLMSFISGERVANFSAIEMMGGRIVDVSHRFDMCRTSFLHDGQTVREPLVATCITIDIACLMIKLNQVILPDKEERFLPVPAVAKFELNRAERHVLDVLGQQFPELEIKQYDYSFHALTRNVFEFAVADSDPLQLSWPLHRLLREEIPLLCNPDGETFFTTADLYLVAYGIKDPVTDTKLRRTPNMSVLYDMIWTVDRCNVRESEGLTHLYGAFNTFPQDLIPGNAKLYAFNAPLLTKYLMLLLHEIRNPLKAVFRALQAYGLYQDDAAQKMFAIGLLSFAIGNISDHLGNIRQRLVTIYNAMARKCGFDEIGRDEERPVKTSFVGPPCRTKMKEIFSKYWLYNTDPQVKDRILQRINYLMASESSNPIISYY